MSRRAARAGIVEGAVGCRLACRALELLELLADDERIGCDVGHDRQESVDPLGLVDHLEHHR